MPDPSTGRVLSAKLRTRVIILLVISVIMLVMALTQQIRGHLDPIWMPVGLALGVIVGWLITRFDHYAWDEREQRVATTTSVFGMLATLAYLVLTFTKDRILGQWIDDPNAVTLVGLWFTFGVVASRVWILRGAVLDVLSGRPVRS